MFAYETVGTQKLGKCTGRVSGKGIAIGHVRPSVCFYPALSPTELLA